MHKFYLRSVVSLNVLGANLNVEEFGTHVRIYFETSLIRDFTHQRLCWSFVWQGFVDNGKETKIFFIYYLL